jgi:hypothetical protein
MIITAFFSASGTPETGLSPTVNIRRIDTGALVITAGAMSEVGDGFYKYDFVAYSSSLEYSILCDGTSALTGYDRYAIGTLDANNDVLATATSLAAVQVVVDLIEDINRNRMEITNSTGAVSLKDDAGNPLLSGTVTDDSVTTIRTRLV